MSHLSALMVTVLCSCVFSGCKQKGYPDEETTTIEEVVDLVPPEFFSGKWKPTRVQNPDAMQIDLHKNELISFLGNEEKILDKVPIDNGYALMLFDPEHSDHPEGIHMLIVLRKVDQDTIILFESPELFTYFKRVPE